MEEKGVTYNDHKRARAATYSHTYQGDFKAKRITRDEDGQNDEKDQFTTEPATINVQTHTANGTEGQEK